MWKHLVWNKRKREYKHAIAAGSDLLLISFLVTGDAAMLTFFSFLSQPFPRREFSASEMNKTLEQLGLVPSGSLVLKKEEAGEVLAAPQAEPGMLPWVGPPKPLQVLTAKVVFSPEIQKSSCKTKKIV